MPSPTCPILFNPQHNTAPPLVTAHVLLPPPASFATPLPSPTTLTGVSRPLVVSSPSWPFKLVPQHFTPPACSAHVCAPPAASSVTPLLSPLTFTAVRRVSDVPSPTPKIKSRLATRSRAYCCPQHFTPPPTVTAHVCPPPTASVTAPGCTSTPLLSPLTSTGSRCWLFPPQHFTPPALVSAQLVPSATASNTTPLFSPTTLTGVGRFCPVPSPNCPAPLDPQHFTAPPLVNAQLWLFPSATATTPLFSPTTLTGVCRFCHVPSPNCPELLIPQHFTPPPTVTAHVWTAPAPTACARSLNIGGTVAVGVLEGVAVLVAVAVVVAVAVRVAVEVAVRVAVEVAVRVAVTVGVSVAVAVGGTTLTSAAYKFTKPLPK